MGSVRSVSQEGAIMSLSFRGRIVGDVTVLHCDGSIVEGAAAAALRRLKEPSQAWR
jgi:hypothetical protein